jgi:diguanylate cyclase (GGDEF)-like protein/PAS domain S-box-containing protein
LEELVAARTTALTRANGDLQREIAERSRVEARLLHSEANLRTLFEVSPVVLVLTRISDQRVILANERACELFEVREEDVVGQRAPDFYVYPNDRARLVAQVKQEGHVYGFEATLRSTSGRQFPALISAQPLTFEGEPALLVSAVDITNQKTVEGQLRELATKDSLTDCLNRRHFLEVASIEFERADRYQRPVSIAMLDADRFKQVNDRFGHETGDRVLRAIADTARQTLRKTDVLGRFGGEEFVILFVETGMPEAAAVTNRLVQAVAALEIEHEGVRVPVALSAGVAERRKEERLESVLRRADDALYRAKEAGRNRVAHD